MSSAKPEYPPLFAPGFHDITLEELKGICVDRFRDCAPREHLFSRFRALFSQLEDLGLTLELWIDGSFSTEKLDPDDVDILVVYDPREVNAAPSGVQLQLWALLDRVQSKIRYKCDVLGVSAGDENMLSYWRGWFGFSRPPR